MEALRAFWEKHSKKILTCSTIFLLFLCVLFYYLAYGTTHIDLTLERGGAAHLIQTSAPSETLMPHVNINTASSEELQTLPGIGATIAERIVAYRTAHGAFGNIEELDEVKGIGAVMFEKLRPYISTETAGKE